MKKYYIILTLLFVTTLATAQTQRGYVKTKGRMVDGKLVHGQGLKGATVSIKGRTAIVVNAEDGAFSFPIPAQTFMVQNVQKNGYQLVDADVVTYPFQYSTSPLYILMETPEQQKQDELDTERKLRRTMQQKLQQREDELEALKAAHKITVEEYQQALEQLYADQESNEKLISDMAKQYAQMDYDQMDELNQRISDAILNGRLTEADSLLRSKGDVGSRVAEIRREQQAEAQREEELAQEHALLESSKAGTQKKLEDVAADCYKFFDLCKLNLEWDSAAYYITLRAELDTNNVEWQYEAGFFLYKQNTFSQAEKYYDRALEICRLMAIDNPKVYEPYMVTVMNSLETLYSVTYRYDKNEAMLLEALEISRRLAKDNPEAYDSDLAMTLNNLAVYYEHAKRYVESAEMYLEVAEIYQRLGDSNPIPYFPDMANTVLNCVTLQRLVNDTLPFLNDNETEEMLLGFLESFRFFADYDPQTYGPDLVRTLSTLVDGYLENERYDECEALGREALEIGRRLAKENPRANEPILAIALHNLGKLYYATQRYDECEAMWLEALEIYKRLAIDNPKADKPALARGYSFMSLLFFEKEQYQEAISYATEATELYRELVPENPELKEEYEDSLGNLETFKLLYSLQSQMSILDQLQMSIPNQSQISIPKYKSSTRTNPATR